MEIFLNILAALLGMLIFVVWNVKKHLKNFSFKILWKENKGFMIWGFLIVVLISLISSLVPDSQKALKLITGLDLEYSRAGYLTLGILLSGISRQKAKKEPNKTGVGSETPVDDDEENDA